MDPNQHDVIIELRALRRQLFESEWLFLSRAREIEEDESRWRADFPTWDALLNAGNIIRPARYRNWCRAVDEYGEDTVREIGIDAAIQLLMVNPSKKDTQRIVEHLKSSARTNHVPLSKQRASEVIARLDTRVKTSGLVAHMEREKTALQQLKEAKRKIIALERENADLRAENEVLRERLMKAGVVIGVENRTARKAARKSA